MEHPGLVGLKIIRERCRPEWLVQPSMDSLKIFARYKAVERPWHSGRPENYEYDKNAQYVGAAASVKLGVGEPEHVSEPAPADRAGLWRVHIAEVPGFAAQFPPIARTAECWLYTPLVRLLQAFGYTFQVYEAWLFPEQHAVLRPFYERMKAMREQDKAAAKDIYRVTFGMLAHPPRYASPDYLYRPDWWSTLVSEARARMYYQMRNVLLQEGQAPSAVLTDALYYEHPVHGLPLGTGIGQFKIKQG